MIAFRNSLFDGQLRRTIGHGTYGGAELGECLATASRVIDGDRESWYRAWLQLADRTFAAAESSAVHGYRESARARDARFCAPRTITVTPMCSISSDRYLS